MQDRKVIEVLKLFSAKELKEFQKLVFSPFFNESEDIQKLVTYISKYAPSFSHPSFTTENAYRVVFPKEAYHERTITKLLSAVLKLAERYIGVRSLQKLPLESSYHLLTFYSERGADKLFESALKDGRNLLTDYPHQDSTYLYYRFRLEEVFAEHLQRSENRGKMTKSL